MLESFTEFVLEATQISFFQINFTARLKALFDTSLSLIRIKKAFVKGSFLPKKEQKIPVPSKHMNVF